MRILAVGDVIALSLIHIFFIIYSSILLRIYKFYTNITVICISR